MSSREGKSELSEIASGNGALGRIADRANRVSFTTLVGVGAIVGAAAGAATAMRSRRNDVITGQVSIDLLKKVELLTIRLHLDRS